MPRRRREAVLERRPRSKTPPQQMLYTRSGVSLDSCPPELTSSQSQPVKAVLISYKSPMERDFKFVRTSVAVSFLCRKKNLDVCTYIRCICHTQLYTSYTIKGPNLDSEVLKKSFFLQILFSDLLWKKQAWKIRDHRISQHWNFYFIFISTATHKYV